MTHMNNTVYAVIVSHYPNKAQLYNLVETLTAHVDGVVIIDNGTPFLDITNATLIPLHENKGVAYAQNVGIRWAMERNADYVILFDQDSLPDEFMVSRLTLSCKTLENTGQKVAAVGPCYMDCRFPNAHPFVQIKGVHLTRIKPVGHDIVPVDHLISSGCLMPATTINAIGMMREDLFIDYIDMEWSLRARSAGYLSYGVFSAHMQHGLGDEPIELFSRKIPNHNALRHYYQFRNCVWLCKQDWVPWRWKIAAGIRQFILYFIFSIYSHPRLSHATMMIRGLFHGLSGTLGRYDPDK